MINNLHISGIHTEVTEDMRLYVEKKIGNLDKFISRHSRQSVSVDVKLKESKAKDKNSFECEVIVALPKATLTVSRKTSSMLASIDEAEANLKIQLKKYKETHNPSKLYRRVMSGFRHKEFSE